jgi:cell division protein FtsZ
MMGEGEGEGENRALKAAKAAIANPLLDDVSMRGAKGVLINITGGYDMTLFEVDEAANEVRREVDVDAHIILGSTFDEKMVGRIRVSVVAAGLQQQAGASARPAPHALREQVAGGLSTAVLNAPSPAAELGLHRPAPAPVQQYQPPHAPPTMHMETVRQPTPIIRPRPVPMAEPEELELHDVVPPAPTYYSAPQPKQMITPPPQQAQAAPQGKSFASLFGWKAKPADEPLAGPAPKAMAEDDTFDDELEIPAFLRRSANT